MNCESSGSSGKPALISIVRGLREGPRPEPRRRRCTGTSLPCAFFLAAAAEPFYCLHAPRINFFVNPHNIRHPRRR